MPRERRDFKRISGIRDPSLIVIAAEGEKTERQYFEGVKSKCGEPSRIQIEVLDPRPEGQSAPRHVLAQLHEYKKRFGLNKDDELCMLIDRDSQSWEEAEIAAIARECATSQYLLALSNPCFEIWLLMHLEDIQLYDENEKGLLLRNKDAYLKHKIRQVLGAYNPSKLNIDDFWHGVQVAVERAESLDNPPHARWPNGLGSRVYLLTKKILEASQ